MVTLGLCFLFGLVISVYSLWRAPVCAVVQDDEDELETKEYDDEASPKAAGDPFLPTSFEDVLKVPPACGFLTRPYSQGTVNSPETGPCISFVATVQILKICGDV